MDGENVGDDDEDELEDEDYEEEAIDGSVGYCIY
jgi:hypothetical protein